MLRTESRFPPEGGYYTVPVGCAYEIAEPKNVALAVQRIRGALTPATADQCEGWLVMLQAACARRPDSEASSAVAYALYASHLRQYPADVAKAACAQLARGRGGVTWFPTLGELIDACERMEAPRKVMLAGLLNWRDPEPPKSHDKSAEDKHKVRMMLEEYRAGVAALKAAQPKPPEGPSLHGATDEKGVTPELRALLARQRG